MAHKMDLEGAKFIPSSNSKKSTIRVQLADADGESIGTYEDSVSVVLSDQHTPIQDYYMCNVLGTTNPSANTSIDDYTITVDSTTGAIVGDCINIKENGRMFQALILSINTNTITFNAPLDYSFTTSAIVSFGSWNMNVDGSTNTVIYTIQPPTGVVWDITRILISMSDEDAMDDGKFGGIPSLTRGVVLRITNSYTKNIFVVNNNGGFAERAYDVRYADKAPAGEYGFTVRRTFSGQDKNGVVIRLNGTTGDQLQLIIQDDLTDLTKLAAVVQGHRTTDEVSS